MNIDRRGILSFLGITFGITYAVELTAILAFGMRFENLLAATFGQYMVAVLMWVPALAAFLTVKFVTKEGRGALGLRVGPIKPYLRWMLLMPVIFAVIYGLTWLLGLTRLDLQMTDFMTLMAQTGADLSEAPPPGALVPILFLASVLTVPFFNLLLALGEEIGWRGYLLPKLLPLGRLRAHLLMGVIWGLWHAPLIWVGFAYPRVSPLLGILAFTALLIALSVVIDELTLRNQHSAILAGWLHGLFNSQKLGIWGLIFPGIPPLLGGFTGLVGIVVWAVIAGFVYLRSSEDVRRPEAEPPTLDGAQRGMVH